jgi:hypothetical protein
MERALLNEIKSRLKAGERVYMLTSHIDSSCCEKGRIYETESIGSSQFNCVITPHNRTRNSRYADHGSTIPFDQYRRGWIFESEVDPSLRTEKSAIDVVTNESQVNFVFSLNKDTLTRFLADSGFDGYDDAVKINLLLKRLKDDQDTIKKDLNEFLFDEQFGVVYQAAEEIYGTSSEFDRDEDEDYEDIDEDDGDYDDDEEEGYF